jgi:hypothetical protein
MQESSKRMKAKVSTMVITRRPGWSRDLSLSVDPVWIPSVFSVMIPGDLKQIILKIQLSHVIVQTSHSTAFEVS